MKKIFLSVIAAMLFIVNSYSQAPQSVNYQAVVRDASGNPVASGTSVSVRFTIHDGGIQGTVVFSEVQHPVTNQFGLISLQIGTFTNLSSVQWSSGQKYLELEIDPAGGSNYTDMGTSQLMSVPYALFAANSANGPPGSTGPTGPQGDVGATGVAGPQGPTGAQGPAGPDGRVGSQGPTGPTGTQGQQGVAGPQGQAGQAGPQGNAGTVGPAGVQGAAGPAGAQGQQGPQGPTGANGSQGLQGNTGPTGSQGVAGTAGAQGPVGPQGLIGNTGPQGSIGTQGATGAQGPTGNDGAIGATGSQGPTGNNGVQGATGADGMQGLTGNDGAIGATGPTGNDGVQGPTGADGAEGPTGNDGIQGPTGNDGAIGATGPTGNDGVQGPTGADGVQGPTGNDGIQGLTGNDGAIGATGPTGNDGMQGPTGADGVQGPTGNDGIQGPTGNDGAIGATGPTGNDGVQGSTGATGATGITGATGVDGSNCLSLQYYTALGHGCFQFDNDSFSKATIFYMHKLFTDGTDLLPWIQGIAPGSTLQITDLTNPGNFGIFTTTGSYSDQGYYVSIGIQFVTGAGAMTWYTDEGAVCYTINGSTGAQGPIGADGVQGPTGANGNDGAVGPTGPSGQDGAQGATGPSGQDGAVGATGPSGQNGAPGITGATGPSGQDGAQGPTGANGNDGATGATGPSGSNGSSGAQGATGATGPSGQDGAAGSTGATGATGPSGSNGLVGATGATGATGAAGANGANCLTWNFGDEGTSGQFAINGPFYSALSVLFVNNTAANGASASTWLNAITPGSILQVTNRDDNTQFGIYTVTSNTAVLSFHDIGVSFITGNGFPSTSSSFCFTLNGAVGATGPSGSNGSPGVTGPTGVGVNGNANYITKFIISDSLGNSQMYDNGTNVGVGTSNPNVFFEIRKDTTNALGPVLALSNYGGQGGAGGALDFYTYDYNLYGPIPEARMASGDDQDFSAHLAFYTKGLYDPTNPLIERMRITSYGNVGINNSAPNETLSIGGNIQIDDGTASAGYVLTATDTSGAASWQPAPGGGVSADSGGYWTLNSGNLYNNVGTNVGVGTNNPAQALDVNGSIHADSLIDGSGLVSSDIGGRTLYDFNGNANIGWAFPGILTLNNPTVNAIIYNNGGQGVPTFNNISTGSKLVIWQQDDLSHVDYAIGTASGTMWQSIPQANVNYWYSYFAGTTEIMRLTGAGNLGINNTNPTVALDVVGSSRIHDGTAQPGYVLTTSDTFGTASWQAPAGGGYWSDTSGNITNNNGGKVQIISGDSPSGILQIGNPNSGGEASLSFTSGVQSFGDAITSLGGLSNEFAMGAGVWGIGGDHFGIGNIGNGQPSMVLDASGNVGIGTNAPAAQLDVQALYPTGTAINGYASGYGVSGQGESAGIYGQNASSYGSGAGTVYYNSIDPGLKQGIGVLGQATGDPDEGNFAPGAVAYGVVGQANTISNGNDAANIGVYGEAMNSSSQQVGIMGVINSGYTGGPTSSNYTWPNAAVMGIDNSAAGGNYAGYFKGKIAIVDSTYGAGKVLTSDASGNASWQTPSGGGSSPWTTNGSGDIYNNNASGNVGIGTTTPGTPLEVDGNVIITGDIYHEGGTLSVYSNTSQTDGAWMQIGSNIVLNVGSSSLLVRHYDAVGGYNYSQIQADGSNDVLLGDLNTHNNGITLRVEDADKRVRMGDLGGNSTNTQLIVDAGNGRVQAGDVTNSTTGAQMYMDVANSDIETGDPFDVEGGTVVDVNSGLNIVGIGDVFGNHNNTTITVDDGARKITTTGAFQIAGNGAGLGKVLTSDVSGNATWQTPVDTGIYWSVNGTGDIHNTNASGFVGIGTTSPVLPLQITNGSDLDLTGGGYLMLGPATGLNVVIDNNEIEARSNGGKSTFHMQADGGNLFVHDNLSAVDEIVLLDDGSFIMGGGTTVSSGKQTIYFDQANNKGIVFQPSTTATATDVLFLNSSATTVGSITSTTTATAYNTSSDYRLKKDIQPMTGGLDRLMQLKPVTYTWKADNSHGEGFIAHELQEVVPLAVTGKKDEMNADGTPKMQAIDQSKVMGVVVAGAQELERKVEAQQKEIEKLKAMIQQLTGANNISAQPAIMKAGVQTK